MAYISVTNTFVNSSTASATEVNTNFSDLVNGTSDGTKDLSVAAITAGGALTANGNVTLGNGTADDIIISGSLAGTVEVKTTATYDIGTTTKGLRAVYLGANAKTVGLKANPAGTANWSFVFPPEAPTESQIIKMNSSGYGTWALEPRMRSQTFTSNGSWSAPSGVSVAVVYGCGGGGGAGGGATDDGGQGGGGAGLGVAVLAVTPGTTYTVTVGTGGGGGATATTGSDGNDSAFSTVATFVAGKGGYFGSTIISLQRYTEYGAGSGEGGHGGAGQVASNYAGYRGGNSGRFKGGGGGTPNPDWGRGGGGGAGGFGDGADEGNNAAANTGGGGGGGAGLPTSGAAGGSGQMVIVWVQ